MIQRVKGTHDYLDLTLFNYILDRTNTLLRLHHFTPIMTPVLEPTELFVRSLGQQTDVVSKEMYVFSTAGGESICLRPEATASTARAFVENQVQQTPWKVFTWGPMFRHERPQKGRYRQFYQVSIEVIGSASVSQDVQLIALLDKLFTQFLAFDSYALQINFLGCQVDRPAYKEILHKFLNGVVDKLCENCKVRKEHNILRVFDCKNPTCQEVYVNAPKIIEHLCATCGLEWQQVQDNLEALSVSFTVRPSLVRGLDYYQKTVFEFVSSALGAQNAFCGGGRYDQLIALVGAKNDLPCVGAAFGIERIMMMLESMKDKLMLPQLPALQVIIPMGVAQHTIALLLCQELINKGVCTEVLFEGSMKNMMKQANKLGAQHVLIIGEDEQKENAVMVKNMITGQETKMKQIEVAQTLKNNANGSLNK
jgi:histidyl-tRNA synthetase